MLALFAALLAVTQQWLVVSDIHVNPFDTQTQPAYYETDTNWPLFDASLAQMRRIAHPSVVIIAGDFLAHRFDAKSTAARPGQSVSASALATMARIERSFAAAFPHAQFVITLGNNDDPCGDYRTAPDTPYLSQVAKIWKPLVDRAGSAASFERDFSHTGSFSAGLTGKLRIIALDDVYWSFLFRPCTPSGSAIVAAQFDWLSRTLHALALGQRSVVIMHIPPGVDPNGTLDTQRFITIPFWQYDLSRRFLTLMEHNSGRISFLVTGHMHRSDFRIAGGVPLLIAPSISPVYDNDPAFLTLQVDSSGGLKDYRMYAYSLERMHWSQVFDFDRGYGVDGFTAMNLAIAHDRISNVADVRETWIESLMAGSYRYDLRPIWRAFWCAQTSFGADYVSCAGNTRRTTFLQLALAASVAALIAALVLSVVKVRRRA